MKKFLTLTLTALLLAVVMSVSLFAFNTTAAAENTNPKNVIFISDNYEEVGGDGSGKDANNPLVPVPVDPHFINEKVEINETTGVETNRYGKYYLESPLYQAAEKLVDTGGTIVICGPISLDASNSHGSSANYKDYALPASEHEITITSTYNGVNYATNNDAKLNIAFPSYLLMGSPATFENITIQTTQTDAQFSSYGTRVICACGNKLVMGNGITTKMSGNATSSNGGYYVAIAGGKRYADFTGDSNITILSGQYSYICGSTWGVHRNETAVDANGEKIQATNEDGSLKFKEDDSGNQVPVYEQMVAVDVQTGDVTINLAGNCIVRGTVCGTSNYVPGVTVDGNVNINISEKASIRGDVFVSGASKFANDDAKAYVKVSGGEFLDIEFYPSTTATLRKNSSGNNLTLNSWNDTDDVNCCDANCTLDIADDANIKRKDNASGKDALLNRFISNWKGNNILYPTSWLDKVECATNVEGTVVPTTPATFINGVTKPIGSILKATFTNKSTSASLTQLVEYDERNTAFTMTFNEAKTGVWYRYGGIAYQSANLTNYVEAPTVELLGARLKAKGEGDYPKQALRFVAEYNLPENVTINEAGILALKSYLVKDESKLTLDGIFGNIKYVASDSDTYSYQGKTRFECTITDINQREFVQDYTARAYVKYTVDETEYVAYSDIIERNPYEIAKQAVANTEEETADTISHLNNKLISVANNFDVKNKYVSDEELDELRRSVVDYMELMANLKWSPKYSFAMYNNTGDRTNAELEEIRGTYGENVPVGVSMAGIFEKGKYYYGMPYTSSSKSWMQTANFESFNRLMELTYEMEEFTEYTGTQVPQSLSAWNSDSHNTSMASWMYYNLKEEDGFFGIGAKPERRVEAYMNYTIIPGSHCSKSVFSAWNLVLNNSISTSRLTATYRIVPGSNSNVFAVGDYNYKTNELVTMTEQNNTKQIIESNGVVFTTTSDNRTAIDYEASAKGLEVMYNAYKSVKPGDGLIHYTTSGHTRLVVDVEYNDENPGASIVKTLECANWSVPFVNPGLSTAATSGQTEGWKESNSCWMVREYSFDNLLISTYIPSRITELSTGLVDKLSVIMTDTDIADGVLNGTIKSNMQIVSVDVTVSGNGINKNETIYLTSEAMHLAKYDITELDLTTRFGLTEGNEYNITLKVGTPGYVSKYEANSDRPNDVDDDNNIAVDYTPTFTTIWKDMAFVAPAALPVE